MVLAEALAQVQLGFRQVHYWFAALCLVAVAYKLTVLIVRKKDALRLLEVFPGPPGHWLVGHVLQFKQDGTDFDVLVKWGKQYPYSYPLWFGPFNCVHNIHHPDYVKTILASAEPKGNFAYRFLLPWIGDGLLLSKGQKWFRHRRLLTPGFHYDVLKPYVKLMSDSTNTMLDKWERYAGDNKAFELFEHVSLLTLDSILKCAFSCDSNCQTAGGTNAYIKAVYELSHLVNIRIRTFPYHSDLIFHLSPHGFRFRRASKVTHSHTEEVIKKRKEVLKEESELGHIKTKRYLDFLDILLCARISCACGKITALKEESELGRIKTKRYLDFLDILLCARDEKQQGLSDEDIRAEVDTFMFEGHDTTASGISFLFYSLACNPEHQKLCRDEIIEVLDGKDTIEWEDLSKIPYTTMCIKESLRLYPPVPGIARSITKPMTFFDGRTLPAGSNVGTSVYGLHRNAAVWENPDDFNPLRFLPENVAKRSPHAFVPFSAGPRNCIGQNFAMNEMKVVAAMTLKRYQLIEDPTLKPKMVPRLVLRSLNGIHIKIKPVNTEE